MCVCVWLCCVYVCVCARASVVVVVVCVCVCARARVISGLHRFAGVFAGNVFGRNDKCFGFSLSLCDFVWLLHFGFCGGQLRAKLKPSSR